MVLDRAEQTFDARCSLRITERFGCAIGRQSRRRDRSSSTRSKNGGARDRWTGLQRAVRVRGGRSDDPVRCARSARVARLWLSYHDLNPTEGRPDVQPTTLEGKW